MFFYTKLIWLIDICISDKIFIIIGLMQGLPQPVKQTQPQEERSSGEKTKKALKYMKIFNIITSLLLIGLSVFSLIGVVLSVLTSLKVFLVFSPLFMVLFGVALLASEFKLRYVLKKVPFLKTPLGRGLFYLYLSSIIYYYFESMDNAFMAWAGALALFASGLVYVAIHFGFSKSLKKQDLEEQYQETYKQRLI